MDDVRRRFIIGFASVSATAVTGCLYRGEEVENERDGSNDTVGDPEPGEGETGESGDLELELEERMEVYWTEGTRAAPVLVDSSEYAEYLRENLEVSIPEDVDYDEEVVAVFGATGSASCHRVEFTEASEVGGSVEAEATRVRADDVGCGAAKYFDHDSSVVSYSSSTPDELVVSYDEDERYGVRASNTYELVAEEATEDVYDTYGAVSFDELAEPLRSKVSEAMDDVHETDEVDEELREFLDGHSYVVDDGYYELSYDVPRWYIDMERVEDEPDDYFYVDDLRDSHPEAREAFEYSARTATNGRDRRGYNGLVLPEGVEEYDDRYDYIAYEVGDRTMYYELDVGVDDPGRPYTVEAHEVEPDEVFEDTDVYGFDDLERDVRQEVESAVEDELSRTNPPRTLVEGYTEGLIQSDGGVYDVYAVRR